MNLSAINGLTSEEAGKRLKIYGMNELQKRKPISPIKIFLSQFNDFITWVLIIAVVISRLMGEQADAVTILMIVIINAILGFIQEYKTEKSLEALKSFTAPSAKVKRDGVVNIIQAVNIVPEDVILLESGDRVPADCVFLDGNNVRTDESLLTGESISVNKDQLNKKLFMGTVVLSGKAAVRVTKTGMKTEMGKIAFSLQKIESDKSPLKKRLDYLGKILVILCIGVCALVTVLGTVRGQNIYQMLLLGVSLAVAAIPEGLTAIVTVALALGVSRMLKRKALVRKLPAVETLGCTSVICSDKTGTLTENNMTVKTIYIDDSMHEINKKLFYGSEKLLECFTYCNDCNFDFREKDFRKALFGDPTEAALIRSFFNDTKTFADRIRSVDKIFENPFDSERKMMSVVVRKNNENSEICYVKGAPERVLKKCRYILINDEIKSMTDLYKDTINSAAEQMSFRALRCIAGAYKTGKFKASDDMESNLVFIGISGMIDPPKEKVKAAVMKCKIAGIRPVMITGDHRNTAFAIAEELEICKDPAQVITGEELDKMTDKELSAIINKIAVFARVTPDHKLKIVKALKGKNQIVAMTGDGVNDAPAVKEADIGIAMGLSGTDVTKEASSMILLDDDFSTIVSAVEEGRVIYNNIRKFIRYLLSCNLGEVLTMFLAALFYLQSPMLPIQILLVNLATDGLPAMALGVDPPDKDIMLHKPRLKDESVFSGGLLEKIFIRGTLIGVCTIMSFLTAGYYNMSLECARTLALSTLILSQLLHVFECRSEKYSIFEINIFSNIYLVGAVMASVTLLLFVIYNHFLQNIFHTISLDFAQWCIVLFFSGVIFVINSTYLYLNRK